MKQTLLFLVIALLLSACTLTPAKPDSSAQPQPTSLETDSQTQDIHLHAGFIVVKDNQTVDFSAPQYMHFAPCNEDEEHQDQLDPQHEQEEKAHLHSDIGDVVHVHRPNAVWADLFTNLSYPLTQDQITVAFSNSQPVKDILSAPITADESVVIVIGSTTLSDDELQSLAPSLEHIQEVATLSETCAS